MMVAGFLNFALAIAAMAFYKTGRAEKKRNTSTHLQHGKSELKPVCPQAAREGHR